MTQFFWFYRKCQYVEWGNKQHPNFKHRGWWLSSRGMNGWISWVMGKPLPCGQGMNSNPANTARIATWQFLLKEQWVSPPHNPKQRISLLVHRPWLLPIPYYVLNSSYATLFAQLTSQNMDSPWKCYHPQGSKHGREVKKKSFSFYV